MALAPLPAALTLIAHVAFTFGGAVWAARRAHQR